jgi:hypothetical protein
VTHDDLLGFAVIEDLVGGSLTEHVEPHQEFEALQAAVDDSGEIEPVPVLFHPWRQHLYQTRSRCLHQVTTASTLGGKHGQWPTLSLWLTGVIHRVTVVRCYAAADELYEGDLLAEDPNLVGCCRNVRHCGWRCCTRNVDWPRSRPPAAIVPARC